MKKNLHSIAMVIMLYAGMQAASAQTSTAFAITGDTKGNVNWSVIREIDISTGALVRNIYLPATENPVHKDALTGKSLNVDAEAPAINQKAAPCGCTSPSLAAASAYDQRQKRLYIAPLFGNELQYIDITKKELVIYHVANQKLKNYTPEAGEGDNITRMVFGSDGNGYTITNNGNHVIRFTTGKTVTITDLGSLKDNSGNTISVHAKAASWGGDLVADDAGSLYLFTVAGHIFKINPISLEATFTGTIKHLPTAFSVNAAAVDKAGNVTIASSVDAGNYYTVNMKTLEATPLPAKENLYNASDFANGNVLATEKSSIAMIPAVSVKTTGVNVYPNPVKNKLVTVYFSGSLQGKHTIEVLDANGKKLAAKTVTVVSKSQSQTVQLPSSTPSGMYMVHVMATNHKDVFTGNIVVE